MSFGVFSQKKENSRKPQKAYGCKVRSGGDKQDRTADLLNAIQALSQLSYTPESIVQCSKPLSLLRL